MHLTGLGINKNNRLGRILNRVIYVYLIFTIIAFMAILAGNFVISAIYSNNYIGLYGSIYFCYFGFMFFGLLIAFIVFKNLKTVNVRISHFIIVILKINK